MKNFFKNDWVLFPLLFVSFLFLSILLRGGGQLYESGIYIDYARSFLQDLDLNLVNQVPKNMAWMVTAKYYFPDFHPEVQTPFILLFYLFEVLCQKLAFISEKYLLSALSINFFILFLSTKLTREHLLDQFKKKRDYFFLLLFFGSTLLYFNFFTATVTDSFSIPILIYILMNYQRKQIDSPLAFGLFLGLFCVLKVIYIPLGIYLFVRSLLKHRNTRLVLSISFFLPILLKSANTLIKTGSLFSEPNAGARVLFDYSFEHLFTKVFNGYFGTDGFFYLNPLLLIGVICSFKYLWDQKNKSKSQFMDSFFFMSWILLVFLHPIFMLGSFVEDLLPGRATLIGLPFFSLGIVYVYERSNFKKALKVLFGLLVLWNIYVVINFVIIDTFDSSLYYVDKFVISIDGFNYKDFIRGHLVQNFSFLRGSYLFIILFALLISGAILLYSKINKKRTGSFDYLARFWLLLFSVITVSNAIKGPLNVRSMKAQGLFENKVVGDGMDLFLHDYLLDRFYSISLHSKGALNPQLDQRIKRYYELVKPQVLKSTNEFDEQMRQNRWDSSYFQKEKR